MLVKYCEHCDGRPYTTDLQLSSCPKCGKMLGIESADDIDLEERPQIIVPTRTKLDGSPEDNEEVLPRDYKDEETDLDEYYSNKLPTEKQKQARSAVHSDFTKSDAFEPGENIRGRVAQYSSTGREDGAYRRLLPVKFYQVIVYRQRLEDVLHRFIVRVEHGKDAMGYSQYFDIPVNVHGTIASGMQITDNAEVEVEGKYRNGVLMASKVSVVNNGYYSRVKFQRSVAAIFYGILTAVAIMALLVFVANTDGNFFLNLKSFLLTWLIVSVVSAVLYLILIFSKIGFLTRMATGKPKKFPLIGILLFSLIVTMIFMNSFGIGASLSGLFSNLLAAIMPAAIIIIVIIVLLKLIFK